MRCPKLFLANLRTKDLRSKQKSSIDHRANYRKDFRCARAKENGPLAVRLLSGTEYPFYRTIRLPVLQVVPAKKMVRLRSACCPVRSNPFTIRRPGKAVLQVPGSTGKSSEKVVLRRGLRRKLVSAHSSTRVLMVGGLTKVQGVYNFYRYYYTVVARPFPAFAEPQRTSWRTCLLPIQL